MIVLVSITVVTLINPVSLRALSTVTSWLGNDYLMSHTQETISPNFSDSGFWVLMAFIVFSIFILALKHTKFPPRMAFILSVFTAMVLLSARNVHFYGVVAPFVLVSLFSTQQIVSPLQRIEQLIGKIESQLRGILWPALSVLVGIILLAITPIGKLERFSPSFFPIQATEWLKSNPQDGNMFNTFDWGGYLSFELWPEKLVFIDSQGDVYGEAFIREYEQIITLGDGWQNILTKYNVKWALVPTDWKLATALGKARWMEVYRDDTAVIFVRGE
jgi:hypothetical protein